MIKRDNVTINGNDYVHTYSDAYFLISRGGIDYVDAYDPIAYANERIYTETDISIDPTPEDLSDALEIAGRLLLGLDEVSGDE